MRMCHFRVQDDPFVLNKCLFLQTIIITFIYLLAFFIVQNLKQIFLWKFINIIFIYLLAPFIVQNLKKILLADPELWGSIICGPKMAHLPRWELFQKPC